MMKSISSLVKHFSFCIGFPNQFRTYFIQISKMVFQFRNEIDCLLTYPCQFQRKYRWFHFRAFDFIFVRSISFLGIQIRFRADKFILSANNFTKWHTNSPLTSPRSRTSVILFSISFICIQFSFWSIQINTYNVIKPWCLIINWDTVYQTLNSNIIDKMFYDFMIFNHQKHILF